MNRAFEALLLKSKSILCVLLILNLNLWLGGCGQATFTMPVPEGFMAGTRVMVGPEVDEAVGGSQFEGATAIELSAGSQTFRLVYPDDYRKVNGTYTFADGVFTITKLHFEAYEDWADLDFTTDKRVSRIVTSDGYEWTRPKEDVALAAHVSSTDVQKYIDANLNLLEVAEQLDTQNGVANPSLDTLLGEGVSIINGSPGTETVAKADSAFVFTLALALSGLATVWGPMMGIAQTLVLVFSLATAMQNVAALRFDRTWTMAPAIAVGAGVTTPTVVVVTGGKITEVTDGAANPWGIIESQLLSTNGANVQWRIVADIELTPIPNKTTTRVEVLWDVSEVPGSPTPLLTGNVTMIVDAVTVQGPVNMT